MKRSSSKLISKAGSVRNINKQGFKFKFEVHVESVDKLTTTGDVCVTWERGAKLLATRPTKIDRQNRTAHFGGEMLSQEVTLFKKKRDNAQFEPKIYKLHVRQTNERGKILARIDLNFSEYVEIPSFAKRIGASMSSGGRLIIRVCSTFLGEAKGRKSKGSASIGSSQFDYDSDAQSTSGMDDQSEVDTDLADLDDLEVDGPISVPLPPPVTAPPPMKSTQSRPRHPAISSPAISDVAPVQARPVRKQSASPKLPRRDPSPFNSSSSKYNSRQKSDIDIGSTNGHGPSRAEFEQLRRENRALQRKNEDLISQVQDLESRMEYGNHNGNAESVDRLLSENQYLKKELEDVKAMLRREPVYADVVRDLREAKMALAIVTLEKDELHQELRLARR